MKPAAPVWRSSSGSSASPGYGRCKAASRSGRAWDIRWFNTPAEAGAALQAAPRANPALMVGGGGRIRTCEPFRASGFQDRRLQPLGHSSRGSYACLADFRGTRDPDRKQSVSGQHPSCPLTRDLNHLAGSSCTSTSRSLSSLKAIRAPSLIRQPSPTPSSARPTFSRSAPSIYRLLRPRAAAGTLRSRWVPAQRSPRSNCLR